MPRSAPASSRLFRPATLIAAAALAAACSGSGEDVRVTLCKDVVAAHTGGTPAFERTEVKTPGYQDAQVILSYSIDGARGRSTCSYAHNAVDDTADLLSDPLRAYATSPSSVVINGESLSRTALAKAVGQAMLKQGRQLLDAAGKAITQ